LTDLIFTTYGIGQLIANNYEYEVHSFRWLYVDSNEMNINATKGG